MHSTTMRQWVIAVGSCCCFLWPALPAAADEHVVNIRDYLFQPASLRIKVGDTVRWINMEKRTSHSIRLSGTDPIESDRLFPGEIWSRQFAAPGKIEYSCGPHPEMAGVIEVSE